MTPFAPPPLIPTPGLLASARPMSLTYVPEAPRALALVDRVVQMVSGSLDADRGNERGPAGRLKLRVAVGAVIGAVLNRWSSDEPAFAFRARKAAGFTGCMVGYRMFVALTDALVEVGLLHRAWGISFPSTGFEGVEFERQASRYWPTSALLVLAGEHRLDAKTVRASFGQVFSSTPPKISHPLELKELQESRRQPVQRPLPIDADDNQATEIRLDVEAHNGMAAKWTVGGCCPPRWARVFHGGWDLQGRWFSAGSDGSYQTLSRLSRAAITMNGEGVVEIDLRASHLAILASLAGKPLPKDVDPYAVRGFPRGVVKQWIVSTLGKGSPVTSWSNRAPPHCRTHDPKALGAALITRHPMLAAPASLLPAELTVRFGGNPNRLVSHYLAGIEATAMTLAMRTLRARDVLALPVHDSLIVPSSSENLGKEALREAFRIIAGFDPVLTSD